MKRHLTLAALVAVALTIAVPSYGQNVINACIMKANGQVRIVNTPSACKPTETPVSWNVQGPAGPPSPGNGTVLRDEIDVPAGQTLVLVSYEVKLGQPSRLYASGMVTQYYTTDVALFPFLTGQTWVELRDPADNLIAQTAATFGSSQGTGMTAAGVLLAPGTGIRSEAMTVPPGTYTLQLMGFTASSSSGGTGHFFQVALSHMLVGPTQ
jgi:hypothetical protein